MEKIERFQSYFATMPSVEQEQDPGNDAAKDGSSSKTEQEKQSGNDAREGSSRLSNDSDGSFFGNESDSSSRETSKTQSKRTKKEIRKRDVAEIRRLAHAIILEDCGCVKECGNLVSRDDRMEINKTFWSLHAAGQKHFIRERVLRTAVEKRSRNVFTDQRLRKRHSYNFHIRTVASDEAPTVCRKFFLNTLGYGEHCG